MPKEYKLAISVIALVWVCLPAAAGVYYVSPTGSAGNPGTQPSPWSLSKANSSLVAGDTAILMDGAYSTTIQPANNGTPGNRITYQAQNQHMATFNGVTNVAYLVGRTYLTIDGIKAVGVSRWVRGESGNSHITITNCYFANASGWESVRFRQGGDGQVLTNNSFINGTDNVSIGHGKNHLVEGNYFDTANHTCMVFLGVDNSIFQNNTLVNPNMKLMELFSRRRDPETGRPSRHVFIQDNHFKYTGDYTPSGSSSVTCTFTGLENVFRRNLVTNCQAGLYFGQGGATTEWSYNQRQRIYHNVFYNLGASGQAFKYNGLAFILSSSGSASRHGDFVFANNILYYNHFSDGRHFAGYPSTSQLAFEYAMGPDKVKFLNNDIICEVPGEEVFIDQINGSISQTIVQYETAWPTQAINNIGLNPMMVNPAGYDAHLLPGSPCIDTGTPLTQTSSAGSGIVVPVTDALYFCDGFGLVAPDVIRVGGETVNIVAVNYSMNEIVVDRSISWGPGAPVSLPWNGSAPDIGIYEYTSPASVAGQQVFYNDSAFDGNDPAANSNDDGAIATDKTALLPGGTAAFANYTGYARGINGVMVDIENLPGTPTVSDFEFKVGNDNNPAGWSAAPAPTSITVRPGEGAGGSDRVTLIWADNAIQKQWLQVTVKATANTGLASDDVFYFGNAIGETGNSPSDAKVTPTDEIEVRNNPHTIFLNPAAIDNNYDFDRDSKVGPTDAIIVRDNGTSSQTALNLINVP